MICAKKIYFAYDHEWILENINFTILTNTLNTFIGPNGGGKTTLIKNILGLLKPTKGTIEIEHKSPQKSKKQLGYVPQHILFDPLFPITVEEIVLMGCLKTNSLFKKYTKKDYETTKDALNTVKLTDFATTSFQKLSGGQRQRVLIARALASHPEILILDEPTAHIDIQFQENFFELLNVLKKQMTILMISHHLDDMDAITDQLLYVNKTLEVKYSKTHSLQY